MSRASIWSGALVRRSEEESGEMSNFSDLQREEDKKRILEAEHALRSGQFYSSQLFLYLNTVVLPREQCDVTEGEQRVLYTDYMSSLETVKQALHMLNQGRDPKQCLLIVRSKYMLFARI